MNEILSFSGQLPEHFDAAFAEIGPELGFARAGQGGLSVALRQGGCLADIAPTMLPYVGLPVPSEMTGRSLIVEE